MGTVKVDCHVHTFASGDAWTTLDLLAERVAEVGLDVVCITDHHEISAAIAARERDIGARIIVGEEIRTPKGELIGLFLKERIPYVLPTNVVADRIRAQGGLVYAPHAFDPVRLGLGAQALDALYDRGTLDVIEVFNSKCDTSVPNDAALAAALRLGVPMAAGSDAHDPAGIGAAWVEMPDFDGPQSFLEALEYGVIQGELRPHALRFPPRPPAAAAAS